MFVGVHAMLAMRTNIPELAITEQEGKAFMASAQNVMRHYSVETTQKTLDWVSFVGCVGSMYGTRFLAIVNRRSSEKPLRFKTPRADAGEKVVPLRPEQPTAPELHIDWSAIGQTGPADHDGF